MANEAKQEDYVVGTNLGQVFSYELPTRTYNREIVLRAFTRVGLENVAPGAPKADEAFTRAMAALKMRGENPSARMVDGVLRAPLDEGFSVNVRKVDTRGSADDKKLIYALNRADSKDKQGDAKCEQTVTFTPTGIEYSTEYLKDQIVATLADYSANPTDADLRTRLVNVVEEFAPLAVKGRTVMFIADMYRDQTLALRDMIRECGARCSVLAISRDSVNVEDVIFAMNDTLSGEINDLLDEISKLDNSEKSRPSSYTKKIATVAALRAKAEMYCGLLSVSADEIAAKLTEIEATIKSKSNHVSRISIKVPSAVSLAAQTAALPAPPRAEVPAL